MGAMKNLNKMLKYNNISIFFVVVVKFESTLPDYNTHQKYEYV